MKGGKSGAGSNIKSFGEGKKIEKGSDPMHRGRGQLSTQPMKMDLKEFNRTKDTSCGAEY